MTEKLGYGKKSEISKDNDNNNKYFITDRNKPP